MPNDGAVVERPDCAQVVVVLCRGLTSHSTHNRSFRGRFYRPDDQTNSVKALKETSWSFRSGLNPTRTTPPCYNNTTLGYRLYAQRKGPNSQCEIVHKGLRVGTGKCFATQQRQGQDYTVITQVV